jgi:CBS domain-containing protein
MKDGIAVVTAKAAEDSELLRIPAASFHALMAEHPRVLRFFDRTRPARTRRQDITTIALSELMTRDPLTCVPDTPLIEAARKMREIHVSCIIAAEDSVVKGILTTGDITSRAVAEGLALETPVAKVMTADPITLPPTALVADVLHTMVEKGITHMPVVEAGKLVGILTQTDLTRFQATSSAALIQEIAAAPDTATLAKIVRRIPELLVQLVAAQNPHQVVTRLITDIGDATTRRLLALAEAKLGPPPVPYLWLACGSQGRQEQTGVSDQDNCLILDDSRHAPRRRLFRGTGEIRLRRAGRGGVFLLPRRHDGDGDPLAAAGARLARLFRQLDRETQPRGADARLRHVRPAAHRRAFQPLRRPAGGNAGGRLEELHLRGAHGVQLAETSAAAGPVPGFATVRSGEHKNTIDLKHNGVVPVTDLGRVYALKGRLTEVNTRARLLAAIEAGLSRPPAGADLIDAYDMIAQTRLEHQAAQIQRGEKPDNFMAPSDLSDFERSHLRDAFVVIKTMQNAAGSSGGGYLN